MSSPNEQIIKLIISKLPKTKAQFDDARRSICSKIKTQQPANRKLLLAYQNLLKNKEIKKNELIENLLRKAQMRTMSGVAIITSLTKPFPCPGKCIYCPDEAKMPKSYLASEPAAARAYNLQFDPYKQMAHRLEMLEKNGHPTDKIEFIVKGGTWNSYPLIYQYWFILESFRACNQSAKKHKNTKITQRVITREGDTKTQNQYDNLKLEELKAELQKQQRKNEKSKHRIIGLTLETRPDFVTPETIFHMRQQGCTRIELGLQVTDNKILELVKRGHTVEQSKQAMYLLRQAGFKVDAHFMPHLPGSNPKKDVEMYKTLFSDIALKPDMVKIYPCTVIKNTELFSWFKDGKYKPYSDKKLFEALIEMKINTPRYCRISRLIRDIPEQEIEAGNKITNLREDLKKEMNKRDLECNCLRCREIGHAEKFKIQNPKSKVSEPKIFVDKYCTIGGEEFFISFEDKARTAVYGFLRLRIPEINKTEINNKLFELLSEIKDCAFIRELHIYGQLVGIGKQENKASQHKGLGKKLVAEAEKIVKSNKFKKIAVISGVGVRDYYRKLGYRKVGRYMVKKVF